MNVLIFHTLDRLDTRRLRSRLPWAQIETQKIEPAKWNGKYTDKQWRDELLLDLYKNRAETVDVVLYITDQWNSSKSNLLGFAYRKPIHSYYFSALRHRENWVDTAEHELGHVAYYLVWQYLGVNLSRFFGVDDYHEDIIHGRHPKYEEYRYDDVWVEVKPYLIRSLIERKQEATRSYQKSLIIKLRELVLSLRDKVSEMETLLHPVEQYKHSVTQAYGVYDRRYTLTHRHIGVDLASPLSTPVRAPWDGTVTVAGYSKALGYHCHFQYRHEGQTYTARFLHLAEEPIRGDYARGDVIARTGNTGTGTGAHVHIDVWMGDVDLTSINRTNWSDLTVDPQKHYG